MDSSGSLIDFTPVNISVIPHIANIPTIDTPIQTEVTGTIDAGAPGTPPQDQMMDYGGMPGGDFGETFGEQPEEFTEEDAKDFSEMIWGMPSMLLGEHLEPDPAKLNKFAHALYVYSNKKGLNPNDMLFDELPLMMIGGSMGLTMYRAHKDHKSDKNLGSYTPDNDPKPERILDKPKKTENNDGIIHGEKTVYNDTDVSWKPETTEYHPEPVEPGNDGMHEVEDRGELMFSRL